MKQNGKYISAYVSDSEDEEYNIRIIPNYLEFVSNIFNMQKFDFIFSRSSQSKHSMVV